jgi:hypothetical protein
MNTQYEITIRDNLSSFFAQLSREDIGTWLGGETKAGSFYFKAFGEDCRLYSGGITLSGEIALDPRGLLVSLYAINASPELMMLEPFRAFRDLPDSQPYHGAFSANSERPLVPYVPLIKEKQQAIKETFDGRDGPSSSGGDFSFVIFPLPKIALCYIFYLPDEEFPASVTCLFSTNALSFMPLDGLADVAEYTSREIIRLVRE